MKEAEQAAPIGTKKFETITTQAFMTRASLEALGLSDEAVSNEYKRLIGPFEEELVGAAETLQTKVLRARIYNAVVVRWYSDNP